MSKKHSLSKEEIVKRFDLPERKSKIATLMKNEETEYCICRSSDAERFMICCDACEEWYHGDCIGISEKAAKSISRYFCSRCRAEDSSLITRYKTTRTEAEKKKDKLRCENCSNCLRRDDCGRCPGCKSQKKCLHKVCLQTRTRGRDPSPEWIPPKRRRSQSPEPAKTKKGTEKKDKRRGRSKKEEIEEKPHRLRKSKESDEEDDIRERYPQQQCYGPRCTKSTRHGSKYCSDECGMNLASYRIYQVLPQRLHEWSLTPSTAEQKNNRALENVRDQLKEVRATLRELDERHSEIDRNIQRAKEYKVDDTEDRQEEDGGTETSMYCVTCGHEIHSRTAIRHMDKCFNKYESQTSFGSIYKTKIQGNVMFCDYFNSANASYCKRLKVLCPEHNKETKPSPIEVCGFPLVTNVFTKTGVFCRASKLNCMRHYAWEKLMRAEIDMERVRQWLKCDELLERERQLRADLSNRGGVLALMLHSTYNHVLMEQMSGDN